jgi:hypothetical protein
MIFGSSKVGAGRRTFAFVAAVLATGAAQAADPAAPSIVVFGSYFPAWILCAVAGVLGAVVAAGTHRRRGARE